ncbi:LuxR C-terminal-related transcriptional regulator [Frisingicoccus sp.]|uniref:LuxR C-terminal-related transcriptional regulator n=1 Tax=Frisingicoccus sp. TaxID=1918627 RepID=UPI003AB6A26C
MDKNYIVPALAMKKLKAARNLSQAVYIYAATGYGKTELVKQYLANRRYTYISCTDEPWNSEILPKKMDDRKERKNRSIIVIDDLHFLKSGKGQREVLELLAREDLWVILISRSRVPAWLMPYYTRTGFIVICQEQLRFRKEEIEQLFSRFGVELNREQLNAIEEKSHGNAYAIELTARQFDESAVPERDLYQRVQNQFEDYLEAAVFLQWEPELLDFVLEVSVVDEFDLALAEMITGNTYVLRLIHMAEYVGDFIRETGGIYSMPSTFLEILRHRAVQVLGFDSVRECMYHAGLYYEMHDRIPEALDMYKKSGRERRIRELLIRNSRQNPGAGYYFELRKYYLQLREEEIKDSAVLMAGMSMLYSLMLQPEQSEYWYGRLKTYAFALKGGERKEAKSQLCYLDIALPHRGSRGMLHIMKQISSMLFDRGIQLPEFSVTSNLPSTMNGGKDFCHWSKYDRELAASVGKLVQRILGRYGKGLVNAALGESLYEKGGDTYEVLTLLSRAEMETMSGGMPEVAFAALGVRTRLHLLNGNLETAKLQIDSFEKRCRTEHIPQLLPNIEAVKCRLALYEGDKAAVERWLKDAPDENQEFFILERYRYLTKVRCYLAKGDYLEAMALLEKVRYYAEICHRTYIHMEIGILTAIARQRQGMPWQEEFIETLQKLSEYQFLRLLSEEGAAVNELLRHIKKDGLSNDGIDSGWLERVSRETDDMAVRYPMYLKRQSVSTLNFTENALAILRLQAEGMSAPQIAERLGLKPENVRYHIKENYRKLGVSGKVDAVLSARSLNLL